MMSITRREILAGVASAAVFSTSARAEPTTAAILGTAATLASLVIEMMKESGSEQKRWDAGFLVWREIADGQRTLLGAIERVDDKLNDVIDLIRDIPAEAVAMEYLSQIINSVRAVTFSPHPEDQHYKLARASFLSDAANIYGKARVTTAPRMAVAASQALAGINSIISIEGLGVLSSDRFVREAIDKVEFACLSLLHPRSTLSASITKFDAKIAEAQASLAADPLYAILIPKLPSPPPSVAESAGVRLSNQPRCWMARLPDESGKDQAIEDGNWVKVRIGTRTPYRRPTFHTRFQIDVFAKPVYGGGVFFELSHPPSKEWSSGVWRQYDEHIVLRNPATQERHFDKVVTIGTDDPAILAHCVATGFSLENYPVALAAFNAKLKNEADLIARKSVLVGLRDLTDTGLRRCRQLKLMATE